MSRLEKKREEMHQVVDKLIDQQKTECQSNSDRLSRGVQNLEKKIREEEDEIMKMLNIFKKTTTKGLDIIEYYEKLCSRVNDMEVPTFSEHNDRQVYHEGDINNDRLKEMIGMVNEISLIPCAVGKQSPFQHKDMRVYTIRPVSYDKAWISYEGELNHNLMNRSGKCMESINKITIYNDFLDGGMDVMALF